MSLFGGGALRGGKGNKTYLNESGSCGAGEGRREVWDGRQPSGLGSENKISTRLPIYASSASMGVWHSIRTPCALASDARDVRRNSLVYIGAVQTAEASAARSSEARVSVFLVGHGGLPD